MTRRKLVAWAAAVLAAVTVALLPATVTAAVRHAADSQEQVEAGDTSVPCPPLFQCHDSSWGG
jgi:hypothetical protein